MLLRSQAENEFLHAKNQAYVEAIEQKEQSFFFLYFNNMKKYLGALRSRGFTGACDSAGCLLRGELV